MSLFGQNPMENAMDVLVEKNLVEKAFSHLKDWLSSYGREVKKGTLNVLFRQIKSFIRFWLVFVFGAL